MTILFAPYNKKEIRPAYISKHNHKSRKQVILLMITDDGERWHYLAVGSLINFKNMKEYVMTTITAM